MDNSKFPILKPVCSWKVENESQNRGFGKISKMILKAHKTRS